jgi:hypothetical protein
LIVCNILTVKQQRANGAMPMMTMLLLGRRPRLLKMRKRRKRRVEKNLLVKQTMTRKLRAKMPRTMKRMKSERLGTASYISIMRLRRIDMGRKFGEVGIDIRIKTILDVNLILTNLHTLVAA